MSNNSTSRRPRGVLALVVSNDGGGEQLPFYPYNPEVLHESTQALRCHRRGGKRTSAAASLQNFTTQSSQFTLVFVADSHNLNSIRFRPLLVEFLHQSRGDCQCLCIPNHEQDQDLLCSGTGFFCLPWTHPNRAGILRLLAVSQVPSVVVVENATGRPLTNQGMKVIESNADDVQDVVKKWQRHESGLTSWQSLESACCIL